MVDGPALLSSVSTQIGASRQAFSAAVGQAGMRAEERAALQSSVSSLATQMGALQGQLDQLAASDREQRALLHQWRAAQGRLDSAPEGQGAGPSCDASCNTGTPPSSNGCGNGFTGKFHSWVMTFAQELTGCTTVPYLWNDVTSCCDNHDFCYGTCGMTQTFCDSTLISCMEAKTNLPACQTVIESTSLVVDILGCSHFEAAQAESVQPRCHSTEPAAHPGCTQPLSDVHASLQTAERVCDTVHAVAGAIMANPVANAACSAVDVVGTGVGLPGVCHASLYAIEAVTSVASQAMLVVDEHWCAISAVGGAVSDVLSGFRRLSEQECDQLNVADCEAFRQQATRLQQKMKSARGLIATASSLAILSSQVLDS